MGENESAARRVALVTGAGYGLGAAAATALARDGFDVVVTDLKTEDLDDTVAAITTVDGARAHAVALDLRSIASIEQTMVAALDAFGRVDVLVNNAGTLLRKAALEVTPEEWNDVIAVNLTGTYFMSQQVARHLVVAGRPGRIISLASTFAAIGVPMVSAYGVSKAAISGLTRMLAVEWAEYGIRVNAVAPGSVETKLRAAVLAQDPEFRQQMIDKVPLGRFGTAEEMAGAISYLASPSADYVNGHTLYVDGGLTIS